MSWFKGKSSGSSSSPDPATRGDITVEWSFAGTEGVTTDEFKNVQADVPLHNLHSKQIAELVAKKRSLNWGSADRTDGIHIRGWRVK